MLAIKQSKGLSFFEPLSIIRVEACSNYCRIYFTNQQKELVVSKVLHWVQQRLPADMFVRVHRSHLVNRMYVEKVTGRAPKLIALTNGEQVPVSRRKKACIITERQQGIMQVPASV